MNSKNENNLKKSYNIRGRDPKYNEKQIERIEEKRKNEQNLIIENLKRKVGIGIEKRPKLVDSSNELVSKTVNYKLEMVLSIIPFRLISKSLKSMNMKTQVVTMK
jgi:hypothetical protein